MDSWVETLVETLVEALVEKQVEEDMETSKSLYNQSIESEISQEEADRLALRKTIMSINNRLTAMERANTETRTRARSKCGGNSPKSGVSGR